MIKLIKNEAYSSKDLEGLYFQRAFIFRAVENGELRKLCWGYYCSPDSDKTTPYYSLCSKYLSDGVIAGHTSAYLNKLYDLPPEVIEVNYPREYLTSRNSSMILQRRISGSRLIEIQKKIVDGIEIKVYNQERALFELIRLEGSTTSPTIIKAAVKLAGMSPDLKKLEKCAKAFGVKGEQLKEIVLALIPQGV